MGLQPRRQVGRRGSPESAENGERLPETATTIVARASDSGHGHLVKNVLVTQLATVTMLILNIVLVPVLLHGLGDVDYGVWRFVGALLGYLQLLDLGLGLSLVHYVSRYRGAADRHDLHRYLASTFPVYLGLSILTAALSLGLSPQIAAAFELPDGVGVQAIVLAGLAASAAMLSGYFSGIIQGYERQDVNGWLTVGAFIGNGVLSILLIRLGFGVVALAGLALAQQLVILAGRASWCFKQPEVTIRLQYLSGSHITAAFGYSFWSFLIMVAGRISLDATDTLVIARSLSLADVTVYALAIAPLSPINLILYRTFDVFLPVFARSHHRHQAMTAPRLFIELLQGMVVVSTAFMIFLWGSGQQIIRAWVGPGYERAFAPMIILTIVYLSDHISQVCTTSLVGIGRHRVLALVRLLQALLNVGLSLALVQRYGLIGVVLGSLIAMVPMYWVVLPWIVCRELGVRPVDFARAVAAPLLVGLPLAAAWQVSPLSTLSDYAHIVIHGLFLGILYPALCWKFALTPTHRSLVRGAIERIVRGLRPTVDAVRRL
jgi:O-antigen/teichoic acid export membrane protein